MKRNKTSGSKALILKFFLKNIGKVLSSRAIQKASEAGHGFTTEHASDDWNRLTYDADIEPSEAESIVMQIAERQHERTSLVYEAKLRLSDTIISQLQRAQKVAIALVEKERDEALAKVKELEKKINSK